MIRHFKTNSLKVRLCTQSQLQLVSLPSLFLALQPSVTSKITQRPNPLPSKQRCIYEFIPVSLHLPLTYFALTAF